MIGRTISHYTILEKLGAGGMGVVYKAEDTRLRRIVALKFLPESAGRSGDEHARFHQEAQAAAHLNHPNICSVHAIEEYDGRDFIDMEFVEGVSLGKLLPVPDLREGIRYAIQIGEALHEAHTHGIVHRDIKCDNIMVNTRGEIKVMDFGLAKLRGSVKLTRSNSTVGTVAYMSPEQLQGAEADARSDLFSFGVVLYELLSGSRPFRGEHEAAMMYSIANEDPPALASLRSDAPPGLAAIVEKMLRKSPSVRYQSAREVVRDLQALSGAGPTALHKESGISSMAVLAFEDMSPGKDQEYLCEGFAEEIINALTKIKTLRVSARTSAFAFKGKQADVREIGSKLNVQAILEGSVRKSANRLRITVQLIKVADGYHLWSERYDRELRDVFEIQDEITENVVRALKLVLTEGEKASLAPGPAPNIEAYEYYLRGRRLLHQQESTNRQAIEMFTRSVEIDPAYAAAYCGIADSYVFRYLYWESTEANLQSAESASRRALELNPSLAEAHTSLGFSLAARKRYDEAQKEFDRAIDLDPTLFEAYYLYARAAFAHGDNPKAALMYREAGRVRQEDYQAVFLLSDVLRGLHDMAGHTEALNEGMRRVERHLALNPNDARAWIGAGIALIQLGKLDRGEEAVTRALAIDPTNTGTLYNAACAFSNAGKIDLALDYLEDAVRRGFAHREWIERDVDLEPLRGNPRYQQLLAGMKG